MATAMEDAEILHKAMRGAGTDDQTMADILCHRTYEQLQSIAASYQVKYGKSLEEAIRNDTSGDYKNLLVSLVLPRGEFYAHILHAAVEGLGTDDGALIDVLVWAKNYDIKCAIHVYHKVYKKHLSSDIKGDTSGNYKRILCALLRGTRDEAPFDIKISDCQVEKDAHDLYKKGEGKVGTDDDFFVDFFTCHSHAHIQAVGAEYKAKHKRTIQEAIKSETSGDYQRVLLALATPRAEYWAKRLHHAVQGLGTDDRLLQRVFVLNTKEHLREIEAEYQKAYKKSAVKDIKGDTSGWYEKTLLALLN